MEFLSVKRGSASCNLERLGLKKSERKKRFGCTWFPYYDCSEFWCKNLRLRRNLQRILRDHSTDSVQVLRGKKNRHNCSDFSSGFITNIFTDSYRYLSRNSSGVLFKGCLQEFLQIFILWILEHFNATTSSNFLRDNYDFFPKSILPERISPWTLE